jgi:hypothetical protein
MEMAGGRGWGERASEREREERERGARERETHSSCSDTDRTLRVLLAFQGR